MGQTEAKILKMSRQDIINKKRDELNKNGMQVLKIVYSRPVKKVVKKPVVEKVASPLHIKHKAHTKTLFFVNTIGEEGKFYKKIKESEVRQLIVNAIDNIDKLTNKTKKIAIHLGILEKPAQKPCKPGVYGNAGKYGSGIGGAKKRGKKNRK